MQLAPMPFVRPGELRKAEWSEINLGIAEWRIPAAKTKGQASAEWRDPVRSTARVQSRTLGRPC